MKLSQKLDGETFGFALRAHRERLNLTQDDLAKLLDVSFESISKWERGLSEPPAIAQEGALARLKVAKNKS